MKKWKYTVLVLIVLVWFVLPSAAVANGKIAFMSTQTDNQQIYVMNPDGTDQIRISNNAYNDDDPAWSPDGAKIAFISDRDNEIYIMNGDGTGQTRLTNNNVYESSPAWAPGGAQIAFAASADPGGNGQIYVINTDGTGQTRLTYNNFNDGTPAWSPNGLKIAFASDRDGNQQIYVMNADGSVETRISNNAYNDDDPAWSPDGLKIAFTSDRGNEIYVMNADGSVQTRLTYNSLNDVAPAWSPDGLKIAFASVGDGGNGQIYVMDADGTDPVRITDNPNLNTYPAWAPATDQKPVAGFVAVPTSGPAPLKVTFTDQSTGAGITSRVWQYKLNSDSTWTTFTPDMTSSFTFAYAGSYDVRLTVTGPGGSDDETKTNYIRVYLPVKVRIVPSTINIRSKGTFMAFITLPVGYRAADVVAGSVICEGAPAIRLVRSRWFPRTFAAVFSRDKLNTINPQKNVRMNVIGFIMKNGNKVEFRGSDLVNIISRKVTAMEAVDYTETMTDENILSQFNP